METTPYSHWGGFLRERLALLYLYSFPRSVIMACDAGSYVWTGTDADLIFNRIMAVDPGSFLWTGTDADLLAGRVLSADPGSYVWTGYDADLGKILILSCDPGSYVWTGYDADLYMVLGGKVFKYQIMQLSSQPSSGGDFKFQTMTIANPDPDTTGEFIYKKI